MSKSHRLESPLLVSGIFATFTWFRSHDWQLATAVLIVVGAILLTEVRVRSIESKIKEMRFR